MPLITVSHLTKTFTFHRKAEGFVGSLRALFHREILTKEAVRDVSFTVERGEFVGFLGPNGAGKTTTLKMLTGILTPTSGTMEVCGFNPTARQDAYKKRISIVMGQRSQMWPTLPAMESFRYAKAVYEIPDDRFRAMISELGGLLDIEDLLHVQVRKLSLGQRMKCELLFALLHDPEVLFLDEPTIGLDFLSRRTLREFLTRLNRERGTTILLTSHDLDDIRDCCQRIVLINQGAVLLDQPIDLVLKKHGDHKVLRIAFEKEVPLEMLKGYGLVKQHSPLNVEIRIPAEKARALMVKLIMSLPISDLTVENATLEEILEEYYGKEAKGEA